MEEIPYEQLDPPESLSDAGVPSGDSQGEPLTITTDVRCPYCLELFEVQSEQIKGLQASRDWDLHIEPVSIFEDSDYSDATALTLMEYSRAGGNDALGLYLELSEIGQRLEFQLDVKEVEMSLEDAGYGEVTVLTRETADEDLRHWLSETSARNRSGPGAVPAVRRGETYMDTEALQRVTQEDPVDAP